MLLSGFQIPWSSLVLRLLKALSGIPTGMPTLYQLKYQSPHRHQASHCHSLHALCNIRRCRYVHTLMHKHAAHVRVCHAEVLSLAASSSITAAATLSAALWLSVLPWLEDSRAFSSSQDGSTSDVRPVEQLLELLQERVLRLYAGADKPFDPSPAPSVSGSSITGNKAASFIVCGASPAMTGSRSSTG